jgi:hypothetical protein
VSTLRRAFLDAARGSDATAQAHHLLAWARAERPALQNLGQLREALASEPQRQAIEYLQRVQFAGAANGAAPKLAEVFAQGFAWQHGASAQRDSPLPPLYPFKLD